MHPANTPSPAHRRPGTARSRRQLLRATASGTLGLAALLGLAACGGEGEEAEEDVQNAGDEVEEGAENAGESVENAADEDEEGAEEN